MVRGKFSLQVLEARGFELFAFEPREKRREKLQVFESVLGGMEDCGGLLAQRRGNDCFDDDDGE
jgi:hypothetical protein